MSNHKKITWASFPADVRDELVRRYETGDKLHEIAQSLDMNPSTLQRLVRMHRENTRIILDGEESDFSVKVREAVFQTPTIAAEVFIPDGTNLTDIVFSDPRTDQAQWVRSLQSIAASGTATVMHLHDIHFPFHNPEALDVVYQLVSHIKPDIIVVGSDAADMTLLSSYQSDPDIDEEISDEFDTFSMLWRDHIRALKKAAPAAIMPYIYGNHEMRIFRYLAENARKLRKTVLRAFVESIKCDDHILYMGDKVDWVRIGPLLTMHGNRYGVNPAKLTLQDVGYQSWVQFGHNHRLSEHYATGELFPVGSVGSGCLCKPAHYKMGRPRTKEQLGTSVSFIDFKRKIVKIDNLLFNEEWNGRTWVSYERNVFESDVPERA